MADQMTPPRPDMMEVLLTLTPAQYADFGDDVHRLREKLELPLSTSNTQVILEAVRRQARGEED